MPRFVFALTPPLLLNSVLHAVTAAIIAAMAWFGALVLLAAAVAACTMAVNCTGFSDSELDDDADDDDDDDPGTCPVDDVG